MIEITEIKVLLVDTDTLNVKRIETSIAGSLNVKQLELVTSQSELDKIDDLGLYQIILTNEKIDWCNVSELLEYVSTTFPSIAQIVFSLDESTDLAEEIRNRYIDAIIGNFESNLSNLKSILNFALQRAKDRVIHHTLQEDHTHLIETTPIGFFRSTEDGKLVLLNPAMLQLFGFDSEEEMREIQVHDLYFDSSRREIVLENFRTKGYFLSQQEKMKKKNGEAFWVSMQARAIYDSSNQLRYYEGSLIDVTEQKELEFKLEQEKDKLKQSENQYRKLFEATGTGICVVNEEMIIEICNSRFKELTGYSESEIINQKKWNDFIPKEELVKLQKLSSDLRSESGIRIRKFETKLINKSGEKRDILVFLDFIPEKKQSISSIIDITESKKNEREIIEADERFHRAKEIAQAGEFEYDFKTGEILRAKEIYSFYGMIQDKNSSIQLFDFIHPEDKDKVRNTITNSIENDLPIAISFRIQTKQDSVKYMYLRAEVVYDGSKPSRILGLIQDITIQREAEEEIIFQETKFKNIFESSPFGMFMYKLNEKDELIFSGTNDASDKILGIDTTQFIGKTIEEAFPGLTDTEIPSRYRKAAKDGIGWSSNQVTYDEGGIKGIFEVNAFQTSNNEMTVAFQDVTERISMQKELIESEEKYRKLVETSPDMIVLADFEGNILFANKRVSEIHGFTEVDEWKKYNVSDLTPPERREEASALRDLVREKGNVENIEFEFLKMDGTTYPAELSMTYLLDSEGHPSTVMAVTRDITERKKTELEMINALNQIEKNLEQFAILVDSIRNPLAVIVGLVDYYGDTEKEIVIKHTNLIDDIISHIEERTLESEEVRNFLKKYFD